MTKITVDALSLLRKLPTPKPDVRDAIADSLEEQYQAARDALEGVDVFYGEAISLIGELREDAELIYVADKGLPPHIEKARDLTDHEETLAQARAVLYPAKEPLVTDENLGARVQQVQHLLDKGDEAELIAYMLGRPVEDVRRVVGSPAKNPESRGGVSGPSSGDPEVEPWAEDEKGHVAPSYPMTPVDCLISELRERVEWYGSPELKREFEARVQQFNEEVSYQESSHQ